VVGGTRTEAVSAVLGGTTSTVKGMGGIIQSLGGFGSSSSNSVGAGGESYTGPQNTPTGVWGYNGTVFIGSAAEKGKGVWVWVSWF
jgi:hypothetical protein